MAAGHFGPLSLFYSLRPDRHSVWTLVSSTTLAENCHRHHATKLAEDAMLLRASFVAQAMYDGLGRAGAAAVLAELRRRFAGRTFDADDLASTALGVGADLKALLGDWLRRPGASGLLGWRGARGPACRRRVGRATLPGARPRSERRAGPRRSTRVHRALGVADAWFRPNPRPRNDLDRGGTGAPGTAGSALAPPLRVAQPHGHPHRRAPRPRCDGLRGRGSLRGHRVERLGAAAVRDRRR